MTNRQVLLNLLKPYYKRFALLILAVVFLGILTTSSQVALTPLAEVAVNGADLQSKLQNQTAQPTLDLNNIGFYIISLISRTTGLTDVWPLLLVSSGIFLALTLLIQVAATGVRYAAIRTEFLIGRDISHRIYSHLLRVPVTVIDDHQVGWLQSRIIHDVHGAMRILQLLLIDGVGAGLVSVFYAALLISTEPRLTAVAVAAGLMHVGISHILSQRTRAAIHSNSESIARVVGAIQERLGAIRDVKAITAEEYEQKLMYGLLTVQAGQQIRHTFLKRVEQPIRFIVNRAAILVVMLYGAWLLLNEELTIVGFGLFMVFAQNLIGPLGTMAGIAVQVASIEGVMEEVLHLLRQEPEPSGDRPAPAAGPDLIEIENVSFAYGHAPVLDHISLKIRKGEMIAVIGRSGAGKTTLVNLLLRFYQPCEGAILFDGIPIDEFDLTSYRRLFGVVSQTCTLLDDTAYQNIAYARPDLTREQVEEAARISYADEFIQNDLPDGYETVLGERGVRLSGGQRQRIAIARAVVHRPPILILDEATSSLDSASEHLVQAAIEEVVKDCTSIVIAHRLSTILHANRIVVLRDGCIVEVGTHSELLARNGEYSELYTQQFAPQLELEGKG